MSHLKNCSTIKNEEFRVLMMIDQFYPVVGGAESQALRISMKLNEKGHKVIVLTRKGKEEFSDNENHNGIDINRLPILGVNGKSKLRSIIPASRWLIQNKDKYDIIHCHGVNPLEWAAYIASIFTKKPYVVKIPLSNFLNYAGAKKGVKMNSVENGQIVSKIVRPLMLPALKFIRKRLIGKADRVFAISPEIQKTLKNNGFKNVSDIPNGIDADKFYPVNDSEKKALRDKLNFNEEELLFMYSGRLSQEKNLMTLLDAWNKYKNMSTSKFSKLILLGGGNHQSYTCEPELRNYTKEKNLTSVIFQGAVSNVVEFLQAGDAFILPSLWEGMSNSLLESMACGLPSIVSDIPGNRTLIEKNKSGLLFETLSADKLCECLIQITDNDKLRKTMGLEARKIVLKQYSIKIVTKNIINEYNKILNIK